MVEMVEAERFFISTNPKGEPFLGKRGLFRSTGGRGVSQREEATLWVLNLCDGKHSLRQISELSHIDPDLLGSCVEELAACGLLVEAGSLSSREKPLSKDD
jgi:aminopeptidase-like protein